MTTRTQRESLKAMLLDTCRMKELAGGHPLMSVAFEEREVELQSLIEALPLGNKEGEAYDRVAATVTATKEIQLDGVFKGILLESWRFDFLTQDGHKISGKIDENLTPEQAADLNREFFNCRCVATLDKTTVLFKNGRERTTHALKDLLPNE